MHDMTSEEICQLKKNKLINSFESVSTLQNFLYLHEMLSTLISSLVLEQGNFVFEVKKSKTKSIQILKIKIIEIVRNHEKFSSNHLFGLILTYFLTNFVRIFRFLWILFNRRVRSVCICFAGQMIETYPVFLPFKLLYLRITPIVLPSATYQITSTVLRNFCK